MIGGQDGRLVGPEGAFETLVNRQITPEDRERLFRIRNALGLGPRDPIWSLFIALDYHRTLYEQIPERIREETERAAAVGDAAARAAARNAFEGATTELSKQVAQAAEVIARKNNRTSLLMQACLSLTIVTVALVGAFVWGHRTGGTQAEARRVADRDWSASRLGRVAQTLAQDDFFHSLARCQQVRGKLIVDGASVECLQGATISATNVEQLPDIGIIDLR